MPIPSEDRQRTTQQTSDCLQVSASLLRKKKPKQRRKTRRDNRIDRLTRENREVHARLRDTEDKLKEIMRQLVAERREKKSKIRGVSETD